MIEIFFKIASDKALSLILVPAFFVFMFLTFYLITALILDLFYVIVHLVFYREKLKDIINDIKIASLLRSL